MSLTIVTRAQWGAAAPTKPLQRMQKLPRLDVYIHWLGQGYPESMSDDQIMRSIQRYHQGTQKWSDVGYNFAVGRSGRAYEGRGMGIVGAHTNNHNSAGMGIVFLIGKGETPTIDMIHTATDIIESIRLAGYGSAKITVHPHMDVEPPGYTECAGPDLTPWARAYNHARDYTASPSDKETTTMDSRSTVTKMYADILPGQADETGIAFWVGKLDRREMTHADLLQHFTGVRLAALQVEVEAIKRGLAGSGTLAEMSKARDDFFKELRAWAAAIPA